MTKVTTSKNNEYLMDFAGMTIDKKECILQWCDERPLIKILPEFLDLEWIRIEEQLTERVTDNRTALNIYSASKNGDLVTIKYEQR